MSFGARIRSTLGHAIDAVVDVGDYTRHLVQGNRIRGDMAWIREGARPVVLVHGFLGNRGTMLPLTRSLQSDGRVVFSYAHGTFNLASLRASATELLQQIRSICEELDVPKVDLVAFSMGGLIALHTVKFLQGHQWVGRIATLGTPFRGSWVSLAGIATLGAVSPSVWQILPGSPFLADLAEAPLPAGVEIRQIHAASDAFVPTTGPIKGVRPEDYLLLPGGHSSLVVAPHFYRAVRDFLDRPGSEETAVQAPISFQPASMASAG